MFSTRQGSRTDPSPTLARPGISDLAWPSLSPPPRIYGSGRDCFRFVVRTPRTALVHLLPLRRMVLVIALRVEFAAILELNRGTLLRRNGKLAMRANNDGASLFPHERTPFPGLFLVISPNECGSVNKFCDNLHAAGGLATPPFDFERLSGSGRFLFLNSASCSRSQRARTS